MAITFPTTSIVANNLFAAIDMGTNSFKLLIVRADPSTGRFLAVDRLKDPVVLGRDSLSSTISAASQLRAIDALRNFSHILHSHRISPSRSRIVATSAVREAANQSEFLHNVHQTLGLEIEVLSGFDEARLIYMGILQFHPVYSKTVLTVDIGGGSTEFVIGREGKVLFGTSLKLGHVTLTQQFLVSNQIETMRDHIRSVIKKSGLIEKVVEHGFDLSIGSSGTIRAIEKAIFRSNASHLIDTSHLIDAELLFDGYKRDLRLSKEELSGLVDRLCGEEGGIGVTFKRDGFSKRRSEFIVAGAVLLEQIFEMLGIDEMEISGYALAEGVVVEKLVQVFGGYDLNANARWRSVVQLATRFNNKKRMTSASFCAGIAKGIFDGLRKWDKLLVCFDDKDLEYLEAACLLHNIGMFTGKKGYHKQSYLLIMNGGHLHGYDAEEIKIIALLAKHHRKKFPKHKHEVFTKEVEQKFRILCVIIRLSAVIKQYQSLITQDIELSHSDQGYQLVLENDRNQTSDIFQPSAVDIEAEFGKELKHFESILKQKLSVVISSTSGSST